MDAYVIGLGNVYFESKKQEGLILTQRNLCPTADASALNKKGKVVSSGDGLSYWDKKRSRYRTYLEQQDAVKENDTSKTMPPISPKAEKELNELFEKACRSANGKVPPVHPAA